MTTASLEPAARIGVVGVGLAGATAARTLRDRGHEVLALDKGRGPGGRMARRREQRLEFDHGAQYFTARDPAFRDIVDRWVGLGVAAPWTARVATIHNDGSATPAPEEHRFVGVPGMNEVVRQTLDSVNVRWATRATRIGGAPGHWTIRLATGDTLGPFDQLVVALPAPQTADLLRPIAPRLAEPAASAAMAPCWAAMITWRSGGPDPGFDAATLEDHPMLRWVARNASKPGRPAHDSWVAHASPEWSREHLERDPQDVIAELASSLAEVLGRTSSRFESVSAHRWRHALVETPVGQPCLRDPTLGITVCGDWLLGPRVECAFLSGRAAADAVPTPTAR